MILSDSEYEEFKKAIKNYFDKNNMLIVFKDDYTLEIQADSPVQETYFLNNIAKICKKEKKEKWLEIITDFYGTYQSYKTLSFDLAKRKKDFEYYKNFITVRFYSKDYFIGDDLSKNYIYLPILEDVYLVLVLDLPEHVRNLDPRLVPLWKEDEKDLFLLGIANVINTYDFPINMEIVRGVPIYLIAANHFFSSIILFDLESHKELVGEYGSLICLPNRHETYIHPINGLDVKKAIECLIYVVKDRYDEPGSISQNLYWYKNNNFAMQEITFVGKNAFVRLSKDFLEQFTKMKTSSNFYNH